MRLFREKEWLFSLLVISLVLWLIFLGNSPLRDWDEGTVAQVAREIWRAPLGSMHWLFPTLGGEPYHNKPPLMHLLIAWTYSIGGVNEWTTRLPGAVLTALGVPLLYLVGCLLFNESLPALFAALVYLTMLPVVRHGRLAMLDGTTITFFLLLLFAMIVASGYLLWRFRQRFSSVKLFYGFYALVLFLLILASEEWINNLLNLFMVLGGGYVLWRLHTQLTAVTVIYGFCGIGLLLASGGTISLSRLAYGIVPLNIAIGVLLSRHPRQGYLILGAFVTLLAKIAVGFAQERWVG